MTERDAPQTQFATDCTAIARILTRPDRQDPPSPEDEQVLNKALDSVMRTLPNLLDHRVRWADQGPEDIAQVAIERFIKAVGRGLVDPDRSPAGYLLTIAMNVVRDDRRRPETVALPDEQTTAVDDVDEIARLMDGLASRATVRQALELAREGGDHTVLSVVAAWLDLAGTCGRAPTSREVALVAGVSKTTVNNALDRFHGLIAACVSEADSS